MSGCDLLECEPYRHLIHPDIQGQVHLRIRCCRFCPMNCCIEMPVMESPGGET